MAEQDGYRRLEDMSLEELWRLFPIVLREHDPRWAQWYADEAATLTDAFGPRAVRVSHIGSTAVPGLLAKPTVDILLEVRGGADVRAIREALVGMGWLHMYGSDDEPLRLGFNKGYTPQGFAEQVFHLHVRRPGDPDELYFRDFLVEHPDTCSAYAALKRQLGQRFEHDRDAYTDAKGPFVRDITARARDAYGRRHLLGAHDATAR